MIKKICVVVLVNVFFCVLVVGCSRTQKPVALQVPEMFSDNMVLQRNMRIPVWGRAGADEKITVRFNGKTYHCNADTAGRWLVRLDSCSGGGPYNMEISADTQHLAIKNILVGEVWLCSGQSNMVLDFNDKRLQKRYASEIASSANNQIRQLLVNRTYASFPSANFKSGGWIDAGPKTLAPFSAAAYFFARALYDKYHVPIGLINACVGGTMAEAWTSKEGLKTLPQFNKGIELLEDTLALHRKMDSIKLVFDKWNLEAKAGTFSDGEEKWNKANLPVSGQQQEKGASSAYGFYLLKKTIDIAPSDIKAANKCMLNLGVIFDGDSTYINGHKIGHSDYIGMNRSYPFADSILKAGKNTILIKVLKYDRADGFAKDARPLLQLGSRKVPLNTQWSMLDQRNMEQPRPKLYDPKNLPASLYNAMIAPLIPFAIRGVIWYQGEYNTDRAYEYRSLFPALIADWRSRWKEGDMPFIYQQLPNFQKAVSQPSENTWAELREAQLLTLNKLPGLGMAVGIDIGDGDQLHPVDKKDVGARMALLAEKIAYGEPIVAASPTYKSMEVKADSVILSFENAQDGLVAGGGQPLHYFAIAGADRRFVWANARIEGDKVIVFNSSIPHPIAVRYGWAGNPLGCNLYNRAGLPASPFRTDDWPGLTFGKKYDLK